MHTFFHKSIDTELIVCYNVVSQLLHGKRHKQSFTI